MMDVKSEMTVTMKSPVASFSQLPVTGNKKGDARVIMDIKHLYIFANGTWNSQGHVDMDDTILQSNLEGLS